jgi:ribulose-phosphate 3-epimerase
MTKVIPAIIPKTYQLLRSEMEQVSGLVDRVQVDIMDGRFAPEASWPYNDDREVHRFDEIVNQDRGFPHWRDLQFEIDLMVENPENVIDDWIKTGASAIIIHADSTDKFSQIAEKLKKRGVEVGMAVLPSNRNSVVAKHQKEIDFLQVMGNDKIGYHGVELDPLVYQKVEDLRERFPELPIGVDIGVNFQTATELVNAGATRLISGSSIFQAEDKQEAIKKLANVDSR